MHAVEEVWVSPDDLVDVDDLPGVPRQGLGRPIKFGKEEIVGPVMALDLFVEEDDGAVLTGWRERAERISERLSEADVLDVSLTGDASHGRFTVNPTCLLDDDADYPGEQVLSYFDWTVAEQLVGGAQLADRNP